MAKRNWIGVLLIVIGAGFLLDRFYDMHFSEIFHNWWAIIFVIGGAVKIIRQPEKLVGGLFLIALGGLLIANQVYDIDFWATAIPLVLIIGGIGFLLRERDNTTRVHIKHTFSLGGSAKNTSELNDEQINVSAIFSGSSHRVQSKKFRGGKISALFGGVELDLRTAEMASSEASLDVDCTFGGVEIKVPQAWQVVVQGTPIFGGIENDTMLHTLGGDTAYTLTVRRLSTVRNADLVVYLSKGKVIAKGSFSEVRDAVPDFDRQAKLMGL